MRRSGDSKADDNTVQKAHAQDGAHVGEEKQETCSVEFVCARTWKAQVNQQFARLQACTSAPSGCVRGRARVRVRVRVSGKARVRERAKVRVRVRGKARVTVRGGDRVNIFRL